MSASAEAAATAAALPVSIHQYRGSKTVIARFVARRTVRSAAFMALTFAVFVASKATGIASIYPTAQSRMALANTFGDNVGMNALLGIPPHTGSVAGLAAWNTYIIMVMLGTIWGFLAATRTFRGDEETGRWEMLLAGQTTRVRAMLNALAGLAMSVAVLFAVSATAFVIIGRLHNIDISTQAALYFALCPAVTIMAFIAVGTLASQLMPTRSRASGLAAAIFGISFLLRAMADTTTVRWVLDTTPLGWAERLHPLQGSHAIWLVPLLLFTAVLLGASLLIARRRDIGQSVFADKDTARPHLLLLNHPITAAFRFTRASMTAWIAAMGVSAAFYGMLTGSAAQAFGKLTSSNGESVLKRLTQSTEAAGGRLFLGIVFLLIMMVLMFYVASAVSAMRQDEAMGYLDNFLVRRVGRLGWLLGRAGLIVMGIIVACTVTWLGVWLGEHGQAGAVSGHDLFLASANMVAPAIFVLGFGIACLGLIPRLSGLLSYCVIGWSFMLQILSSGIHINHWVMDTAVLTHVALAPSVSPRWGTDAILILVGVALAVVGTIVFTHRDITSE